MQWTECAHVREHDSTEATGLERKYTYEKKNKVKERKKKFVMEKGNN